MDVDDAQMLVGRSVARQRHRLGMTQRDLAAASGVAQAMIARIERGSSNVTLATLVKLADALGVDVCELVPF